MRTGTEGRLHTACFFRSERLTQGHGVTEPQSLSPASCSEDSSHKKRTSREIMLQRLLTDLAKASISQS